MTRTAVAAPAPAPFDDLLESIDAMDGPTLRAFIAALRERYGLAQPQPDMTIRNSITWSPGTTAPDWWWCDRGKWGTFS